MLCLENSSTVFKKGGNVVLLTAAVFEAVVGIEVQIRARCLVHYCCRRDTDLCVFVIILNVFEIVHTLSSLVSVTCIDSQLRMLFEEMLQINNDMNKAVNTLCRQQCVVESIFLLDTPAGHIGPVAV